MKGQSHRRSAIDSPEVIAFGVQAHPALIVHPEACLRAFRALVAFGLGDKVPLAQGRRARGTLDGPPAFFGEVHLFEADFETLFTSDAFIPDICDTEPAHDIVAMRELSLQSFGSVT